MAVHRAVGTRDPIPYPRLECDDNFVGKRDTQVLFFLSFFLFLFYKSPLHFYPRNESKNETV